MPSRSGDDHHTRIVKAEPVARLECLTATQDGSFREWKLRDSTTGTKDLRCRGRSLGTCFDQILPDSKRCNQKFVFFRTAIPRRHRQTRMQKRLSARSSGTMESIGSGGTSDSGLSRCVDDTERLRKKNLLAGITFRYRHKGICRLVGISLQHRMCSRSG